MLSKPYYLPADLTRRYAHLRDARKAARRIANRTRQPVEVCDVGRFHPVDTVKPHPARRVPRKGARHA